MARPDVPAVAVDAIRSLMRRVTLTRRHPIRSALWTIATHHFSFPARSCAHASFRAFAMAPDRES